MKNFRKVLALILVVATLFSFVAMASAKTTADYADGDDVKYVEAVDVLSSIGILKGYDGKYHPTDDIDRDEMAKMIAVLRNGGEDNSALFTGANTFADVKGTWAEGYIAYAAQVGIINGRNATTFDPDGKVTGTEVMKMLLCVLGYDAKEQGYVGANWQTNVLRDAVKMDLMADMEDFDPYAATTRDEAAQLMFNALKANMVVGYVSENIVKLTNSLYLDWPWNKDWVSTPDAEKADFEFAYCNSVLSNVPLFSIIDDLSVKAASDCYMRPGHVWVYGEDEIGFYADAYEARQTEGGLNDDYIDDDTVYYVDGKKTEKSAVETGNGVVVEYYDDRAVVINTFIAEVGTVNEYYNYFTLVTEDGTKKYDLDDYELAAGDMVLYWTCKDGLHDVEVVEATPVEIAEGVNYKDWNASYIVADGETYKYAVLLGKVLKVADSMDRLVWANIEDNGAKYDLYFDEHGYIKFYAPTAEAATEYSYTYLVEGSVEAHEHGYTVNAAGQKVPTVDYVADMVNYGTDGTLSVSADVAVDETVEAALLDEKNEKYDNVGVLAQVYTADELVAVEAVAEFANEGTELSNKSFALKADEIYATSQTVFMIRTKNLDGSYTYEQVTGYKNLKGSYIAKNLGDGKTNVQYFTNADHPAFASYVFIDAVYTRDFNSTFITLGEADYYAFKTDLKELYADDYVAYNVLVNGEEAVVLLGREVAEEIYGEKTEVKDYLKPATMYEATVSYIGVAVTIDGTDMPIYCVVSDKNFAEVELTVGCYYTVVDGEAYIRFEGSKTVYEVAEDAIIKTLTANDVDGDLVVDVVDGILTVEGEGHYIKYCYVNDYKADGVVNYLYLVDAMFVEALS